MAEAKQITIAGGGIAGLALGVALRQRQVPVVLCEAGSYPRHRVCGEFISGRGQEVLARLGLDSRLIESGARSACSVALFVPGRSVVTESLPRPALCISRYRLDDFLAREFQRLGGQLRERVRVKEGEIREGVVRATGRRIQPLVRGWRWFGLKVHARNVSLVADLEMHFLRDRYVGLCRLDGEVNVCGLFRSRTQVPDIARRSVEFLRGEPGSELHARLSEAVFDQTSFCAVAGLNVESGIKSEETCAVGDALTMTPPLTGNGMSMAFESAELAVDPLFGYSNGGIDWQTAYNQIRDMCVDRFESRLRFATLLQRGLFVPGAAHSFSWLLVRSPKLMRVLFNRTR